MEEYFTTVASYDFLAAFRQKDPDPTPSLDNKDPESVHQQVCHGCQKDIMDGDGFYIESLYQHFHPNCFRCFKCNCSFSEKNPFIPCEGKVFCERDFLALGAICNACKTPIKGRSLVALGQNWHPEHFTCSDCKKQVSAGFYEHQGKVYCEKDYKSKVLKCQICNVGIGNTPSVPGSNGLIHQSCLRCNFGNGKCAASSSSKFYMMDSSPICEYHFHSERKTLCPACDTGIDGYCAEIDENTRFHRECWTCAACNCFLEGSYYIHMGGAYCEKDIQRLLPNSKSLKKRTTLIYDTSDRKQIKDDFFRESTYSRY